MILTEQQTDTLTEVINIAFSRTAAALSDLTGRRVLLHRPQVRLCAMQDLPAALNGYITDEVATVHQVFTGPVSGDALLALSYEGAVALVNLLAAENGPRGPLNGSAREVLVEVGNVLLNACLGMFGNLLQVHVSFAVPRLYLESLDNLLQTILVGGSELCHALVVYTKFQVCDSEVSGYLVIVLGVTSLERLLQAIEALG